MGSGECFYGAVFVSFEEEFLPGSALYRQRTKGC